MGRSDFFALVVTIVIAGSCNTMAGTRSGGDSKNTWSSRDTMKVLAIGNSFSVDAVESYLFDLAKAEGYPIIIGNMYIGGAPLKLHVQNAQANKASYDYRKINTSGIKKNTPRTSISKAVSDERWNFISFQQASPYSGQFDTYQASLPILYKYVDSINKNPGTKYILHQTWAYSVNSKHKAFSNYDKDQLKMYHTITSAVERAKSLVKINLVIPSGTAIQNARASSLGDNLTRDGYHLSIPMGRYVAACTWFEMLFKKSVVGNTFIPQGLTPVEAAICQNAAHAAVKRPSEITVPKEPKNAGVAKTKKRL